MLENGSMTIYEVIKNIENGKFVIPAFQRQFLWKYTKIEKLWDSILLGYPISTFLFWQLDESNTTSQSIFFDFLEKVTFKGNKEPRDRNTLGHSINLENTNIAILDGQQRITSLFISLLGSTGFNLGKSKNTQYIGDLQIQLDNNRLDVNGDEVDGKKYDISFAYTSDQFSPTKFKIKNILSEEFRDLKTRKDAIDKAIVSVPNNSKKYAKDTLETLCNKVYQEDIIQYTKAIDFNEDDALEMFVRFNSGGERLQKSDITFSIIQFYWPEARAKFDEARSGVYENYGTDFIVRTALMLFGDVIKSNIDKDVVGQLKNRWDEFTSALLNVQTLMNSVGLDLTRFSSSWNVIVPVVYFVFWNSESYLNYAEDVKKYILRSILFKYYASGTTGKLKQMRDNINQNDYILSVQSIDLLPGLHLTNNKVEDIMLEEKGSRVVSEALFYLGADWCTNSNYDLDHLHPSISFERLPAGVNQNDWRQWSKLKNKLPNLHLYAPTLNVAKSDYPLSQFVGMMNTAQKDVFYYQGILPANQSLEIINFGNFYEERKNELVKRITELL